METTDCNRPALDESSRAKPAAEALLITSTSSLQLMEAFDQYLAILDSSGLPDLTQDLNNGRGATAQGGTD